MEFKYFIIPKQIKKDLDKFDKENPGKIVVRFPPAPSGMALHLGHSKGMYLNACIAVKYKGKLIIRIDDTNPLTDTKESADAILEDIKFLGCKLDHLTYSSDHFELLINCCEKFISEGKAYVDLTDSEMLSKSREAGVATEYRDTSIQDNMDRWNKMKFGELTNGCVRLKIDMNHKNKAMRDFAIFRPVNAIHYRTKDKFKVYPTYDFSCPIVDSIEGITHVFRSVEFNERDEQYEFILKNLGMRMPMLYHYGKLSIKGAEMSKRKIKKSIEDKIYSGWDDPRLYTIRGLFNRGLSMKALEEFMNITGYPPGNMELEPDNLWSVNRKIVDKLATRYVVLPVNCKSVDMKLGGNEDSHKLVDSTQVVKFHRNPDLGKKTIYYTDKMLFDVNDINDLKDNEEITLMNYGNVIYKDGLFVTNTKGDFKTTSKKILWLPISDENKNVDVRIRSFDSDNKEVVKDYYGEPDMITINKGDYVQFLKMNYYVCCKKDGNKLEFYEML
jgi:glutamyl-tRNA synthetase